MCQVCQGSVSKPGRTEILLEQQTSWFIGGSIWSLVGQAGYALYNIDWSANDKHEPDVIFWNMIAGLKLVQVGH